MPRRRFQLPEMGEALSFDTVLTILTVLLVLRVVFLVPMVNIDKAKTESERKDQLWTEVSRFLKDRARPGNTGEYDGLLGAARPPALVTMQGGVRWIEAELPESTLVVMRHDLATQDFVLLRTKSSNAAPSFRFGKLLWSQPEQQWFPTGDSVDYGDRPISMELVSSYRQLVKARREGSP
jgi:hypothetical protein